MSLFVHDILHLMNFCTFFCFDFVSVGAFLKSSDTRRSSHHFPTKVVFFKPLSYDILHTPFIKGDLVLKLWRFKGAFMFMFFACLFLFVFCFVLFFVYVFCFCFCFLCFVFVLFFVCLFVFVCLFLFAWFLSLFVRLFVFVLFCFRVFFSIHKSVGH